LEIALDVVKHAVNKTFSRKLTPDKLEANIRALQEGYESVERVATAAVGNGRAEALVTLPGYAELAPGGVVVNAGSTRLLKTGGWRGGLKPAMNSSLCVNCLLCWVNCPDGAIVLRDTQMTGFDYNHCKGCGICANACPTTAIKMIREEEKTPEFGRFERSETW
jgi:2-oxoacid:acceptor oxidoreductase delta subunit (pyruvate/2-ketoisovalerate family)